MDQVQRRNKARELQSFIGVRVSQRMKEEITELIEQGKIFTEAEFVRAALNEKLRTIKGGL